MTIGNAMLFIRKGLSDNSLRKRINSAGTASDIQTVLDNEHLSFSSAELEDAFTQQLLKCQYEDAASQLKEFKMWWDMVSGGLSSSQCGTCSGKC